MATSRAAYVVSAKRTPFGAFGGSLKNFTGAQLGGLAGRAALAELPEGVKIDEVVFGGVLPSDPSSPYLARHVGHLSGLSNTVPALTVNRLCGSGIQSLITATHSILLGEQHAVLYGGAENMSLSPYTLSGSNRWGTRYGVDLKLQDSLAAALVDQVPNPTPMGITAENLAAKYGITRADCDAYALQSQQRYAAGLAAGAFSSEIIPVTLPAPSKSKPAPPPLEKDEHPRPKTTLESLAKLPSVFKKDGVVTAGNASGICDGAAAGVVVSEEALGRYGIKPLAKIVGYGVSACDPSIMGIGPVEAIKQALGRASLKLDAIDLIEVNEAFAGQWLAVQKELGLDNNKTNVFGGAVALGHPLGASGARIVANLTHNLHRLNKKYAIGSACIGGGQGIAVVLERA